MCDPVAMPRYSAFVALSDGPGRHQELEELIEAEGPRAAAQRAIDRAAIHPDDQFPVILIVEERHVSVFSRDDDGLAVTPDEDFARLLAKAPTTSTSTRQNRTRLSAVLPDTIKGAGNGSRPHPPRVFERSCAAYPLARSYPADR
jgi:hypothetical protein